jgi:hypothetical protein
MGHCAMLIAHSTRPGSADRNLKELDCFKVHLPPLQQPLKIEYITFLGTMLAPKCYNIDVHSAMQFNAIDCQISDLSNYISPSQVAVLHIECVIATLIPN